MTSTVAPLRILLVDDHDAIHDDVRKILQPSSRGAEKARRALLDFLGDAPPDLVSIGSGSSGSFEFADASQGEQGVEVARLALTEGRPFDLAIVDMRMPPGIDGLETAERLRAQQPALPILFCTAFSDHSDQELARRLAGGPMDIVRKPLDPKRLRSIVDALLAG